MQMQKQNRSRRRPQAGHDAMRVRLRRDHPNTNLFAPLQREPPPDWSELPFDLLPIVFQKLGAVEVLIGAGLVCRSWREAARAPEVWRCVDMEHHPVVRNKAPHVLRAMAKLVVDRTGGRVESFTGARFVTDELVKYISQRSSCLKRLSLSWCSVSDQGFLQLIRSPLLEEILIYICQGITKDAYQVAPTVCPQLKRFMIVQESSRNRGRHVIRTMVRFPKISFIAV